MKIQPRLIALLFFTISLTAATPNTSYRWVVPMKGDMTAEALSKRIKDDAGWLLPPVRISDGGIPDSVYLNGQLTTLQGPLTSYARKIPVFSDKPNTSTPNSFDDPSTYKKSYDAIDALHRLPFSVEPSKDRTSLSLGDILRPVLRVSDAPPSGSQSRELFSSRYESDGIFSETLGTLLISAVALGNLRSQNLKELVMETVHTKRISWVNSAKLTGDKAVTSWVNFNLVNNDNIRLAGVYLTQGHTGLEKFPDLKKLYDSYTSTEQKILEAALVVGKGVDKPTTPVKSGIVSAKVIEPQVKDPWFNQFCSDIADLGRGLIVPGKGFSGSSKDFLANNFIGTSHRGDTEISFMRTLAWVTCGKFMQTQGHKFACRATLCNSMSSCSLCPKALENAS